MKILPLKSFKAGFALKFKSFSVSASVEIEAN